MIYFLPFLSSFLGRPTERVMRISSIAERSYKAVGPAYSFGFIPFLCNCLFTVSGFLLSVLAISVIVNPSAIYKLSTSFYKKSINVPLLGYLLYRGLVEFRKIVKNRSDFRTNMLTFCPESGTIKV